MLLRYRLRNNITHASAIPNKGFNSNYRSVVTTLTIQKKRKSSNRKKQPDRLNMHKHQDKSVQIQNSYEKLVSTDSTTLKIEKACETFSTVILDTVKEFCGTKISGGKTA